MVNKILYISDYWALIKAFHYFIHISLGDSFSNFIYRFSVCILSCCIQQGIKSGKLRACFSSDTELITSNLKTVSPEVKSRAHGRKIKVNYISYFENMNLLTWMLVSYILMIIRSLHELALLFFRNKVEK